MKMKKMLSVLLASAMILGLAAPAAAETKANAADPVRYEHDGRVTFIEGAATDAKISDYEGALDVINAEMKALGGDDKTELVPWRTLTDANGNQYYVFQQMQDATTVLGGAVKVITDKSGKMLALSSSIVSDLPEAVDTGAGIDAKKAEQIVVDQAKKDGLGTVEPIEGLTNVMILPRALEFDITADDEDMEGARYVWVVYTENPRSSMAKSTDLPYLAHYVTLSGEYIYSLPTIAAGDESGNAGFDASYVFEFMEPAEYTGYVDLSTGEEMEVTVTVMKDKRTGTYYLGDPERRIVVADCWEFFYNNNVVIESSPDNL